MVLKKKSMAKNLFKKIKKSQKTALKGIMRVYKSELSFRIQFWWGLIVIVQAFYWPIGEVKTIILLLLVALMLVAEILNTTFEKLFDEIENRYRAKIGYLKDILAGAALLIAMFSAIIGLIIFWPYILEVAISSALLSIAIIGLISFSKLFKKKK
jgi:diacylglycerol kinase